MLPLSLDYTPSQRFYLRIFFLTTRPNHLVFIFFYQSLPLSICMLNILLKQLLHSLCIVLRSCVVCLNKLLLDNNCHLFDTQCFRYCAAELLNR